MCWGGKVCGIASGPARGVHRGGVPTGSRVSEGVPGAVTGISSVLTLGCFSPSCSPPPVLPLMMQYR